MIRYCPDFRISFGDMTLSSVTSIDDELVNSIRDIDGAGVPNWINFEPFRNKSVFQELRLASSGTDGLDWMVGLSYFNGENIGYYLYRREPARQRARRQAEISPDNGIIHSVG